MMQKDRKKRVIPILVSGGARSGKSDFAEKMVLALAAERASGVIAYIATAQATDPEFEERIAHHQARRSARFKASDQLYGLAVRFFPLVGAFLGLLLWLLASVNIPPMISAPLLLGIYYRMNGFTHFDGLCDVCTEHWRYYAGASL